MQDPPARTSLDSLSRRLFRVGGARGEWSDSLVKEKVHYAFSAPETLVELARQHSLSLLEVETQETSITPEDQVRYASDGFRRLSCDEVADALIHHQRVCAHGSCIQSQGSRSAMEKAFAEARADLLAAVSVGRPLTCVHTDSWCILKQLSLIHI